MSSGCPSFLCCRKLDGVAFQDFLDHRQQAHHHEFVMFAHPADFGHRMIQSIDDADTYLAKQTGSRCGA